ncbi:MAG: hypothetical protein P1U49_14630 [Minwuia sp.]|nr:hypothetical protein [Minwuia sp.]
MSLPSGCLVATREKGVETMVVHRDAMDLHVAHIDHWSVTHDPDL